MNGLHSNAAERGLLTESLLQEYEDTEAVGQSYDRFRATLAWALGHIAASPMSEDQVILKNFADLAEGKGTMGMLLRDPKFYDELMLTIKRLGTAALEFQVLINLQLLEPPNLLII